MTSTTLNAVQVGGLRVAYREEGSGPPVVLLHGWPTSSYLWREVMLPISRANRIIAPDLPGFGESDKPVDIAYDFGFFDRVLDEFLAALGLDRVGLAVHDLGGPVGLHWAVHRPARLTRLALLNTLVFPEFSSAVLDFAQALLGPDHGAALTSPAGLERVMRTGLAEPSDLKPEVLAAVVEPFRAEEARRALALAGVGLRRSGFAEIARALPGLRVPVRVIYGDLDRLLPDVAQTMARIKRDVPQAEITPLRGRGHFIQEESPQEVGEILAAFFAT